MATGLFKVSQGHRF